jgi:putative Mn2+ efflux pump MntP
MAATNDFFIGLLLMLLGGYCSYEGFRPDSPASMAQYVLRAAGVILFIVGMLSVWSGIR